MDKQLFKAEVKKELFLHKWSYIDLSERTGYTPNTIKQMMYDDTRLSPGAMEKIGEVLGINTEA